MFGDMFGGEMPDMGSMPQGMQMPNMGGSWGSSSSGEDSYGKGGSSSRVPNMGNMQMPGGMNFGGSGAGSASGNSPVTIVLLMASVIVMLAGLFVAYKFKR